MVASTHNAPQTSPELDALPRHVAIIMDGNGRWAKAKGLPRAAGHKKGAEALRVVMNACRELGIPCLTIYAFSAENWRRPAGEIADLMGLLRLYLQHEINTLHKNGVRLCIIGDRDKLEPDIRKQIADAEALTRGNNDFTLTVALSYGARQELVNAVRAIAADVKSGVLETRAIDERTIADKLYTGALPDPDLLIRTGGEQRLSNFLLWQSAYTELYFTPILWPDFNADNLKEAVSDYGRRERRYGTTGA